MLQPALRRGRNTRLNGASSIEGKYVESLPMFIRGKRQKNKKNGKGRGSVYFENEGSGVIYARER